jgi:hypothetical protein
MVTQKRQRAGLAGCPERFRLLLRISGDDARRGSRLSAPKGQHIRGTFVICPAPSGLWGPFADQPGRCPGLICRCPSGRKEDSRLQDPQ